MDFCILFIVAFVGGITPGPDILLVMRNTLRFGGWQGIKVFCGIATGWIIFLSMIYFGFVYVFRSHFFQLLLSIVSGCYLIFVAYQLIKAKFTSIYIQNKNKEHDTYFKALFINLTNPKAILFFSIMVAPFMQNKILSSLIVLFCGLSSAFLFVIFLATFFRHMINDKAFYYIDKLCALLFSFFAILLFYHAWEIYYNMSSNQ
ncbi:LysE family translocator [Helicobacter didelphidarum]|uniref:LysE family translocator n=1 Tax=Helicobacter didelphidarum TaxID=2040648 RepID=A0A3D8IK87_9HELI|nr:LysE family translocator [Helicobacter didelphidarum]RDU65335.1 LysE family translocator [Helicobacter didelphidarum]